MNNDRIIPSEIISNKIYLIRGQKVMLDRDLAELYDVKNTRLREQVKRNIDKFPKHFMFRLSKIETNLMVSQNAIPSKQHLGGSLSYVFTEHGILQLSNVIKTNKNLTFKKRFLVALTGSVEMTFTFNHAHIRDFSSLLQALSK